MVTTNSNHHVASGVPVTKLLFNLANGGVVHIPVGGAFRPFMRMRQGAPDADYNGWDDAVFFIQMMGFEMMIQGQPLYEGSPVDTWLENDFLQMLPAWLRSRLVRGRIPFAAGFNADALQQGISGLLRKAFILSTNEIGAGTPANTLAIGSDFGAFPAQADRILRNSAGGGVLQHTRTVNVNGNNTVGLSAVGATGSNHALTANMAIRPVIALPPDTRYLTVDDRNILVDSAAMWA